MYWSPADFRGRHRPRVIRQTVSYHSVYKTLVFEIYIEGVMAECGRSVRSGCWVLL